jgi:undecaprenyl-diphosphatase
VSRASRQRASLVLLVTAFGLAGLAFTFLGLATETAAIRALDAWGPAWARAPVPPLADRLLRLFTEWGRPKFYLVTFLPLALFLACRRHYWAALMLAVAPLGGTLLNEAIKEVFDRHRPGADPLQPGSFAYPSGHVMAALPGFGFLAYLAAMVARRWWLRALAIVVAAAWILLMSASRVYLGAHWISDILGAWLAGGVWLAGCILVYQWLLRREDRLRAPGRHGSSAPAQERAVE